MIDGAGWWARFRYVVLPALRSVIQLWVMILIITVFVSLFPWIYTLTRGGPGYSTTTLDFDIYQNASDVRVLRHGRGRNGVPPRS